MFHFLSDSTSFKRFGGAATLAVTLCLGSLSGCSKNAPTAQEQTTYYLDGKPSTKTEVDKLAPAAIASVNVLSGKQATDYTHDSHTKGVVLVQTK